MIRKWTILKAIVKTYLETGEPVGSRTISKYADLNLSSATIRNEMSDLEEMGYILQPHTSAGRIPSDAGYRLYVDRMMEEKDREVTEMKELVIQRQDKMELLLKQMVKVLAANTNYAAMISGPQYHRTKLKFIQLSIVSDTQILATVVAEGNVVKNKLLEIQHGLDQKTVLEMNILLNSALNGLTIRKSILRRSQSSRSRPGYSELVNRVLDAVAESSLQASQDELEIYTSGTTNIFKYPELSSSEKASELISTFEDKKELADIVSQDGAEQTGIQVYIGGESPVGVMQDCSVVTATYGELGKGVYRQESGVVGPEADGSRKGSPVRAQDH
ncbi:MAG: heat-inducible transcriptional repressor HrcA [Lachnospiraceae bacterium]